MIDPLRFTTVIEVAIAMGLALVVLGFYLPMAPELRLTRTTKHVLALATFTVVSLYSTFVGSIQNYGGPVYFRNYLVVVVGLPSLIYGLALFALIMGRRTGGRK